MSEAENPITRGQRAAAVLGNPLFQETFDALEDKLMAELRAASTPEAIVAAHARLRAHEDVALAFKVEMERGEYAAEMKKRAEKRENERNSRSTT